MLNYLDLSIAFLIALISTYLLTYPVKKLAHKLGVMDFPTTRKIHKAITPKLGGLAIFLGVILAGLYLIRGEKTPSSRNESGIAH